jgi:hypothetical protein
MTAGPSFSIDRRSPIMIQKKDRDEFTVAGHFVGKAPAVRKIYDRVIAALAKIGKVRQDPKKTSIHLVRSSALAGVEVRKDYLLLNIKTDYPIRSPRVVKGEQLSAKRFHHKVKLSSPEEVDRELQRWLQDAYDLSG